MKRPLSKIRPVGPFAQTESNSISKDIPVLALEGRSGEDDTLSSLLFTIEQEFTDGKELAEFIASEVDRMPVFDSGPKQFRGVKKSGSVELNYIPIDNMNMAELRILLEAAEIDTSITGGEVIAVSI